MIDETKKVLIVGPIPPPSGGIATVIDSITNSELAKEYSFEFFDRSERLYQPLKSRFDRSILKLKRAWKFFCVLRSNDYAFLHVHGSTAGFFGDTFVMLIALLTSSRVLLHLHGTDWESFYGSASIFRRAYVRIGLAIPVKIVVLYDLWARNIHKINRQIDVRVIRNFVPDCPLPSHAKLSAFRKTLGILDNVFVISSIGRVGWRKGSFDIVEATKVLVTECDNWKVLLIGDEEYDGEMNQIKEAVSKNKLDPWIQLIGEVNIDDIPSFLGISDIFLLPSYREGMPMSIIEAMRNGKPVISTRVGGIPDMIETGVSGILINPGVPEEIASAVLVLRNDPILREKLSVQARKVFETKFETSQVILELKRLYQEMITTR